MPKRNIAIIKSSETPYWHSVEKIRTDLISMYKNLDAKVKMITFDYRVPNIEDALAKLPNVEAWKFVFIDSHPHPLYFIEELLKRKPNVSDFAFHIYGSFTHSTPAWKKLFALIAGKNVQIYAASQAQQGLVRQFLKHRSRSSVEVLPFPAVAPKTLPSRDRLRREFGFENDEFVLCYTGRISLMKNLDTLVLFLERYMKDRPTLSKKLRLVVAGDFDDVGANFLHLAVNEYFNHWKNWFSTLKPEITQQIKFLGYLQSDQHNKLLKACDLYASLSTFHDEDFGRAPLEALLVGTPCLITRWGGFIDLKKSGLQAVSFVAIRLLSDGIAISYRQFRNGLDNEFRTGNDDCRRASISSFYSNIYGFPQLCGQFRRRLLLKPKKFYGGSRFLDSYASKVQRWKSGPRVIYKKLASTDSTYKKIYSSYFG